MSVVVCGGGWVGSGVRGCAQVCAGVSGCSQVCVCVFADVWGRRCTGVHGFGSGWKGGCAGVHGCVHMCRMNFQNFFRRIESLHQRTLIRILYEFFIYSAAGS